jgi:nuclease HARBI1
MQERFRRSEKELSEIGLYVLKFLYLRFGKHLQKPCFEILRTRASEYAEGIIRKGSPLRNCIGFIDGTLRPICRPMLCQESCYNGHKRKHCVKFQSLITPDGLFAQLYGPIEGRRHDLFLLHSSSLIDDMKREIPNYLIYGDPAYPCNSSVLSGFQGRNLTVEMVRFNRNMSKVRQSVEWGFHIVLALFPGLEVRNRNKIFLSPVGAAYIVCGFLGNIHNCLYPNQISQFFGVSPPCVEDYVNSLTNRANA